MRSTPLRRLLLLFALAALAACHSPEQAPAPNGETPEAAMRQSIARVRAGDFAGFWRHALPPGDYALLRADWNRMHASAAPPVDAGHARLDATLRALAAPGAEATLDAPLQAWLADTQARYGDQLPFLIGIARALATRAIEQDPDLGDTQKQQAIALVEALGPWARQAPWFDPARARQALGVAAATARELDLGEHETPRTMDFDRAMRAGAIAFRGLERLLDLYGLPLDPALASARVVPLDYRPPYARVRIEYRLLDRPLSMETTLVRQNGRWYDQELLESVRRAHRRLAAPATATTATAAAATAASAAAAR